MRTRGWPWNSRTASPRERRRAAAPRSRDIATSAANSPRRGRRATSSYTFADRDIRLRYRQTALGVVWVVLQPLIAAGIFTFVFGTVAHLSSDGKPYLLFTFAALAGWNLFSGILTRAAGCLVGNANLVSRVFFPRLILPLSVAARGTARFRASRSRSSRRCSPVYGVAPTVALLTLPFWILLLTAGALGAGLVAASLMVRYRDVQYVLPVAVQLLLYASPVAYAAARVPERWRSALLPESARRRARGAPLVAARHRAAHARLRGVVGYASPRSRSRPASSCSAAWSGASPMSSDRGTPPAIAVRGVSKRYFIGHRARPTTLAERLVQAVRHPFARDAREALWALKDCSFDVGAGRSRGHHRPQRRRQEHAAQAALAHHRADRRARSSCTAASAALLEVGTGFHPELTGRENVYLNGTILGMRRREIAARFDEIVAFAEVERFLDTPVKHYSSGMYVRLAFAVAAHLEPEILIVDEVLAVGDSEFQRKCLGKMEEVAHAGRTVLFVSHNMQAVSTLTRRTLVLDRGSCVFDGPSAAGIAHYRAMQAAHADSPSSYRAGPGTKGNRVLEAGVLTSEEGGVHAWGRPVRFEFLLDIPEPTSTLSFSFKVLDADDRAVCHMWCFDSGTRFRRESGRYRLSFDVPAFRLFLGSYTISTFLSDRRTFTEFEGLTQLCPFSVTMEGLERPEYEWTAGDCAYLEQHRWTLAREGSPDPPQEGGFRG